MTKRRNPVAGILLSILPMLAAFICQIVASVVVEIAVSIAYTVDSVAAGKTFDLYEFAEEMTTNPTYLGVTVVASEVAMILCGALWYFIAYGKKDAGPKTMNGKTIPFALVAGIALQVVLTLILTLVLSILPESVTDSYTSLTDSLIDSTSWYYIMAVGILAPFGEELFFRGITLKLCENYFSVKASIIIQAFLFGALHVLCGLGSSGTIVQGIYAFAIGLLFGVIAAKFKSVWPSFLLHAVVNSSALVISALEENLEKPELVFYGMLPIGFICLGIAIFIFTKFPKIRTEEVQE
ncbi:MAG: CPBP family intramembrane metalloprotease [Lachnospiraceae bacterium]|nr:CPBP family intramembrane metalloprotease [Lachnospiraceae bacterium]